MDSGHKGLLDIELIVDGLNHRGKTIGGTRSTGDELHIRGVLVLVDTHDNSRRIILGRGREDDLLGTRFDMWLARFGGKEGTGRLAKVVHTKTTPWDLRWVTGVSSLDGLTRDNKIITLDL